MTQPFPRRPRSSRRAATNVALAVASALGVALLVTAAWIASRPASYGWFAYAPLSDTTFTPSGAYPPGQSALLAAGGALLLGLVGGFVLGRRARPTPPTPGEGRGGDAASGTA
ncbi:hypothetical protein IF650_06775 [Cellulosimicrobium terreum]|nr:hypothetical protein [Cellulosimicrobium terreum]